LHDGVVLDVGGQYRARYHHEHNFRGAPPGIGLGLTGLDDEFLLHRTRLYGNLEIGCRFRAYVEYIDAVSFYENLPPRPIEENRSDLLNAFGEMLLWDDGCHQLRTRAGRQELIYGAQRMISPLDWANTRRTFQGYKGMYTAGDWNIDGFWVNPIDPDARNFDSPNQDEEFMGVWATNKSCCDQTVDLMYLRLLDGKNQGAFPNNFDFHTLGGRVAGTHGCYQYEAWGAYQFGDNTNGSNDSAGAFTLGLGRSFDCCCWKPAVWFYYDWASGANQTGAGNGYHHLFPLAHKYLGFMDLYGRRNIETPNVLFTCQPHERVKLSAWYYYFMLQNGNDTPYSVVMTPYNPGNAPRSRELGHEIDLTMTYKVNDRTNVLLGYSHFFAGDYYRLTPGVAPNAPGADFFYSQLETNF
ncbi:MAG: alginate export family protein, partial [Planctomycetales bacterium]|nr:alginate export family protein [Planctomycetales bacterium]